MKRYLFLAITVFFMTCRNPVEPATRTVPGFIDQAVVLQVGQTVEYVEQGYSINFSVVEEDSRCPINVRCVWEGNAAIRLEVNGEPMLINTKTEPTIGHLDAYSIHLLELNPYPVYPQPVPKEDYKATIMLSRN